MSNRKMTTPPNSPPETPQWPLAGVGAGLGGVIRHLPEDFCVEEWRPEPLSGDGEHWVVRVEKRGLTTDQVAQWLAQACAVGREAVGFAGQKDRHAVTIQDFSVHLPGAALPEGLAERMPAGMRLLEVGRHRRKIRPGHLAGNHFRLRVRGCQRREEAVAEVAQQLTRHGVPNYFGPQRFGYDGDNAAHGRELLAGTPWRGPRPTRHQQGLYLSAVRSELFNQLLARRIEAGLFQSLLEGDVAMLAGRSACFRVEKLEVELPRFLAGEIVATGPLFGRKLLAPGGVAGAMEAAVAEAAGETVAQLERFGLDGERRPLALRPAQLTWTWEEEDMWLCFTLPRGAYATVVVRAFMEA